MRMCLSPKWELSVIFLFFFFFFSVIFLTPHKPTRSTEYKTNNYFWGRISTKADTTCSLNIFVVITGYTESWTYTSTNFREKKLRKEIQSTDKWKKFFSTEIQGKANFLKTFFFTPQISKWQRSVIPKPNWEIGERSQRLLVRTYIGIDFFFF